MCYVHNQWYDISCATLYFPDQTGARDLCVSAVDDEQNSETVYHGV